MQETMQGRIETPEEIIAQLDDAGEQHEATAFVAWMRTRWAAMSIKDRAEAFRKAFDEAASEATDWGDLGYELLMGYACHNEGSGEDWRQHIRAEVVYAMWYEWNKMQVAVEGDGQDASRRMVGRFISLHDAIREGQLNAVVTYSKVCLT